MILAGTTKSAASLTPLKQLSPNVIRPTACDISILQTLPASSAEPAFENAALAIDVTFLGIFTDSSILQPQKALSEILVRLGESISNTIFFKEVLYVKHEIPRVVIFTGRFN